MTVLSMSKTVPSCEDSLQFLTRNYTKRRCSRNRLLCRRSVPFLDACHGDTSWSWEAPSIHHQRDRGRRRL